jgi:hypothetical protein
VFLGCPCSILLQISSFGIFLCIQRSSIYCTWPSQLILLDLTNLTMSARLRMDSILWLDLSPFSIQWNRSTDSSDHICLKDSQGLFICSFQGLDFSSIFYLRSCEHSEQRHVTSLTEKMWPMYFS